MEAPDTAGAGLSPHLRAEIDRWIARFPAGRQRSAVIAALHAAQHENNGYLTRELMEAVGAYLGLPPASKVVLAANDIAEDEYNRPSKSELSVAYNRLVSEAVEAILPADSVGEVLTSKIEAAEIRCNEAQRLVQELSLRLSVAKAQAEEEAEVLRILDELSCKPVSVIRAILG